MLSLETTKTRKSWMGKLINIKSPGKAIAAAGWIFGSGKRGTKAAATEIKIGNLSRAGPSHLVRLSQ